MHVYSKSVQVGRNIYYYFDMYTSYQDVFKYSHRFFYSPTSKGMTLHLIYTREFPTFKDALCKFG